MKNKKLFVSFMATALAVTSLATVTANAEETTESVESATEIATELTTEVTTEVTTEEVTEPATEIVTEETTEAVTEEPTEDATEASGPDTIGILDGWTDFGVWNGSGSLTGTVNLSDFESTSSCKFGALQNLSLKGEVIDNSNYSISQADGSISVTLNESYLKTLSEGKYYVEAVFAGESTSMETVEKINLSAFNFTVETEKEEEKKETISVPKTGSPKTGVNGIGAVLGMFTVSGITAFMTRKKK